MLSRVILFTLAGLAAGFLTWLPMALGIIFIDDKAGKVLSGSQLVNYQIAGMIFGVMVAMLLGVADMLSTGRRSEALKVLGIGLFVGFIAGIFGMNLGMAVFGPLYSSPARTPFHFIGNLIARGLGWAFIGAFAGTAEGWRKLNLRVGRNGLIGGALGGLLGGMMFEVVPYLMPGVNSGPAARFVGFLTTGAMIGLFVALVREFLKEAWVRVVLGRNEGKEYLIDSAETKIGRAELSEIPLFGDPNIARTHAVIRAHPQGGFAIYDTSESPVGLRVNDSMVRGGEARQLISGDQIQVGGKTLIFYEKAVRTRTAQAPKDVAEPRANRAPDLPSLGDLPAGGIAPTMTTANTATTGRVSRLVVIAGPHTGAQFPIATGAVLGRDPNIAMSLAQDTKASRNHATVIAYGTGFTLEDLNSTNGTFVNGQRITRVALAPGDVIVIGTTQLRVE
jgi:pSer/pThr/pTyr-binding forkhead associated (FHA) protein